MGQRFEMFRNFFLQKCDIFLIDIKLYILYNSFQLLSEIFVYDDDILYKNCIVARHLASLYLTHKRMGNPFILSLYKLTIYNTRIHLFVLENNVTMGCK